MKRFMLFLGLVGSGSAALAGDKPIYADIPAWVKPAPPIDTAKLSENSPPLVLLDNQQQLEDGRTWAYFDTATLAGSAEMLGQIGTVRLEWQPSHGDLILHRAEILRGTEHIDVLKGGASVSVLRREQALEQRMLDGVLTATLAVEGLRVGDVLRLTYSLTSKDPTLKGRVQTVAPMVADPVRVQFGRVRLLWPKGSDLKWKSLADGVKAEPVTAGGYRELTVALPLAKQPEIPNDAPVRFRPLPIIEASSFADWADVAAVMAPLYATDNSIAPQSPLALEVARIEAAAKDPAHRAALALQLVQEKVRYQLMGMATGNYVPQTAAETWSLRYGDCKAKTLLLLALLHKMGIEAEPVLASIQLGGLVANRVPAAAAFDHVLVRATIDGETLWLDGTGSGARYADLRDTPPLGQVLPLRAAGAALMPIAMRASNRPDVATTLELDQSLGVQFPAPFTATVTMRGGAAEMMKAGSAQASSDQIEQIAAQMVRPLVGDATLVAPSLTFDAANGTATLTATGIAYPEWKKQNERWSYLGDPTTSAIKFEPDRARAAWREIPVSTGDPTHVSFHGRIKLPHGGKGFTLSGNNRFSGRIGGGQVDRSVSQAGEWVTIDTRIMSDGAEIPAAAIPQMRKQVAAMASQPVRILAPADYPNFLHDVEAARGDRRLAALLAVYDRRVAAKPKEAEPYLHRAWFNERIFDRRKAVEDLGRALAFQEDADTYLKRASLHQELGDKAKAIADAEAAVRLDPSSDEALITLATLHGEFGNPEAALSLLQERIDAGGEKAPLFLATKAEIEADAGKKDSALATIDAAIAGSPGRPDLLNRRCWLKGTLNVGLDTALKDCTRAIELSDAPFQALDSRAMVHFRLNRMEEALEDLDAALAYEPELAASLYLRGIIRKRTGKAELAASDLAAARLLHPGIEKQYQKYGIAP